MIKYFLVNGEVVPREQALIGVEDLALLRGYGMFDFFLVRKGHPLFFDDYLDRFEHSASLLHLTPPYSREEIKQFILQLLQANGIPEAGLKLVLTGGYSPDGYSYTKPNLIILQSPLPRYSTELYEKGVKLMLHEYHRSIPTAKTINYIVGINLLPEMRAAGAEDILFHSQGLVYETTRANFFIVKNDGAIVTAGEEVLGGITRKKTLETARKFFKVEVRNLLLDELKTAREAFITSSTKQIMPVSQVDNLLIGDGMPGETTRQLMELLRQEVEQYLAVEIQ